jgi:hypothetical protein
MQRERLDPVAYLGRYDWGSNGPVTPTAEAMLDNLTKLDTVIYKRTREIFGAPSP